MILRNKRILLGVSGGIAAYKVADLASKLTQAGAQVDVIMTAAATEFVGPLTFAALTHRPVHTDTTPMADVGGRQEITHVHLARQAELFIVAPATAQTLAKLALGLADDMLGATALSCTAPLLVAPAMESHMWRHPATQQHITTLQTRGVTLVGPQEGRLASGARGIGRMAEPSDILELARAVLGRDGPLAGRQVIITAGGTLEPVDPVRVLTNRSSGRMGVALAQAARDAGAAVTLAHAPLDVPVPPGILALAVESAQQMRDAVMAKVPQADVFIGAAAVADFRPADVAAQKIKKGSAEEMTLRLARNPDILAEVGQHREQHGRPLVIVGFAAETENLLQNATAKMGQKRLDFIVANDVSRSDSGFAVPTNKVSFLTAKGEKEDWPLMSKDEVAERVITHIAHFLAERNQM